MKRIYNDIPLQSVLYTVSGLQKIKIIDRQSNRYPGLGSTVLFEGLYNDFRNTKWFDGIGIRISRTRIEYSAVHGIDVENNTLVFTICTLCEEY